jgi:hypothetical protein
MISNACATMRTAISFLPLLRPFIIKLEPNIQHLRPRESTFSAPVNQSLDDGHLCLLELLLGITASSVGQVDSMTDLDVVREGNVLHFDTGSKSRQYKDYVPTSPNVLLGVPLSKQFNFLTEF